MIVFGTPAFLWGLVASVLPWILRRKVPRQIPQISFAFISFLREVEAQEFLSPRIQEWLLLILRILIIVGLVLAAADPVWVSGEWGRTADQARATLQAPAEDETVLLVDRSSSMRRKIGDVSVWQLAVDRVQTLLESNPDRAWAVGFWTDGGNSVAPFRDRLYRGNVADLVEKLHTAEPLDRPSDFQVLLNEIQNSPGLGAVVLFTDHQASGWRGLVTRTQAFERMETPLWVVPLGDPPKNGLWIDVTQISSFPWAVNVHEEIRAVVRQWGSISPQELEIQFRLDEPDPLVLAEEAVLLDSSPPSESVVDHPVDLMVNVGNPPEEAFAVRASLVLIARDDPNEAVARVSGQIPILREEPLFLIGEGIIQDAMLECLRNGGSPSAFQVNRVGNLAGVPEDTLNVATLSSLEALPGGLAEATAWIRRGGRCLLLLDHPVNADSADSTLNLLFAWTSEDQKTSVSGVTIQEDHPIGRAFSDWPEEAWDLWRSLYPGHSPSSRPVVYAAANETRTDLIGEAEVGLGQLVYINLGPEMRIGSLFSPLFPVAVLESLKYLVRYPELDDPLYAGRQAEHDIRPLSGDDRRRLEQTVGIHFVTVQEISRPGSLLASPVRFRSAILGIVILLGIGELWLANRGIST